MASEIDNLINSWIQQYGVEWRSTRGAVYFVVPTDPMQRREMLRYLLHTLIADYGYDEDQLSGGMIRGKIINACKYDRNCTSAVKQDWYRSIEGDYLFVLAEKFKKEFKKDDVSSENKSHIIEEAAASAPQPERTTKYKKQEFVEAPIEVNLIDLSKLPKVNREHEMISDEQLLARFRGEE